MTDLFDETFENNEGSCRVLVTCEPLDVGLKHSRGKNSFCKCRTNVFRPVFNPEIRCLENMCIKCNSNELMSYILVNYNVFVTLRRAFDSKTIQFSLRCFRKSAQEQLLDRLSKNIEGRMRSLGLKFKNPLQNGDG